MDAAGFELSSSCSPLPSAGFTGVCGTTPKSNLFVYVCTIFFIRLFDVSECFACMHVSAGPGASGAQKNVLVCAGN